MATYNLERKIEIGVKTIKKNYVSVDELVVLFVAVVALQDCQPHEREIANLANEFSSLLFLPGDAHRILFSGLNMG